MLRRCRLLQIAVFLSLAACGRPAREARDSAPNTARGVSVVVPTVPRVSPAPSAATTTLGIGADGGKTLSAGAYHTCALLDSGAVKCWGQGGAGQLGLGDFAERGGANGRGDALPAVDLGTGRKAIAVTAGGLHTCALLDTGAVKCWGRGAEGQLGLGSVKPRGGGANEMGDALPAVDLGTGRKAIAVSAGTNHTCALLDTGAVKCWGQGDYGQLGLGDRKNRGGGPAEMGDALPAVDLGTGRKAIAVSAGRNHTCAVLDDGAVKCWGYFAQLGLGARKSRGSLPNEMGDALPAVDLGKGARAVAIRAAESHTCALLDDGAVKCWGEGGYGQLGLGDTKARGSRPNEMGDALPAVDLGTGRTAVAVTVGAMHTCALLRTGAVKCWGYGNYGQLGLGDGEGRGARPNEMGDALPAVDVGVGRTAVAVSAGHIHTCALLATGAVKCWGFGDRKSHGAEPNEMGEALPAVDLGGLVR